MLLSEPLVMFAALCLVGVAIGGLTAFVIFWPLALVHLRDRHPARHAQLGESPFLAPAALKWLLGGGYRALGDRQFSGLATPARIAALVVLVSLSLVGLLLLWLSSGVLPA